MKGPVKQMYGPHPKMIKGDLKHPRPMNVVPLNISVMAIHYPMMQEGMINGA